jgi:hypothetical protein
MHSGDRDSDVRGGFIGAHQDENRDCTLDANVQDRKRFKSVLSTLPAPQTVIPRCPDSAETRPSWNDDTAKILSNKTQKRSSSATGSTSGSQNCLPLLS